MAFLPIMPDGGLNGNKAAVRLSATLNNNDN